MPNTVDTLAVQINASARSTYNSIQKLSGQLKDLSNVLQNIDTTRLDSLNANLKNLGTSMQSLWSTTKTADFSRVKRNLDAVAKTDAAGLYSAAHAIEAFNQSISRLNINAETATDVASLAKSISKLGSKSVATATEQLPDLATALNTVFETLSTSPEVSRNVVDMTNALANLASQGRNMASASKYMVNGLKTTEKSVTTSSKKVKGLAAAFGKLYASYFLVIRGVKAFYNSIKDTSGYIESFNYFTVTFDKIGKEWARQQGELGEEAAHQYTEQFTTELNKTLGKMSGLRLNEASNLIVESGLKNLGMSLSDLTQYASSIASITNAVGLTGEVSTKTSKAVTMLAADLGSLKNVDFDQVSANIQSALTGQARALYKYGIDVTNATLETYAATYEINKNVSEMTQSEKLQLRLLAILDQSKVAWGDLANTIESPSNLIRQLSNNLKECGTVLGQLFIPMLSKVLPVINGITIAIKRMLVNLAGLLGVTLDLEAFGEGYTDALDGIEEGLNEVADASKEAKKGIRAFDELNVIGGKNSNSVNGISEADTDKLANAIKDATEEYERIWNEAYNKMQSRSTEFADTVEEKFRNIAEVAEPTINALKNFYENVLKPINTLAWDGLESIYNNVLLPLGKWTLSDSGIPKLINAFTKEFDSETLRKLSDAFDGLLENLLPLNEGIGQGFVDFLAGVSKFLGKSVSSLIEGIGNALEKINVALSKYSDKELKDFGERLGTILGVLATVKAAGITASWLSKIGGNLSGLITNVSNASLIGFDMAVITGIAMLADKLVNIDTDDMEEAAEALQTSFSEIQETITNLKNLQMSDEKFTYTVDAYFKLANKDGLSSEEEEALKQYAQEIVNYLGPDSEVAKAIDLHTGQYTGTESEIRKMIKAEQDYIKLKAGEEMLIDLQKQIFTATQKVTKLQEEQGKVGSKLSDTWQKMVGGLPDWAKFAGLDIPMDMLYNLVTIGERGEFEAAGAEITNALEELVYLREQYDAFSDWLYDTGENTGDSKLSQFGSDWKQAGEDIKGTSLAQNMLESLRFTEKDLQEVTGIGTKVGKTYGNGVVTGVEAKKLKMQKEIQSITKPSKETKETAASNGKSLASKITSGMETQLTGSKTAINNLMQDIVKPSQATKDEAYNGSHSLGENVGRGVIDGINSQLTNVGGAGQNLGSHVIRSFALVTQIQSPSKVFKKFGEYIDEGLAIGITKFTDLPTDATAALADAVNSEFSTSNLVLNTPEIRNSNNIASALSSQRNNNQQSSGFMDGLAKQITGALTGNNTQVTFQVEGDPNGLFKVVQKEAKSYSGRTGQIAFGI